MRVVERRGKKPKLDGKTFTRRTFQMLMSSLKGCTHVLRCNWVWCLLGTLKLFRSCPLYFERWNEPLRFLTLLALKIHVVLYCKSADSQQTEGQAPATPLVWVFQAIKWMAASKRLWGGTCAVKRIYWKGARRDSYTVAGDFPGVEMWGRGEAIMSKYVLRIYQPVPIL